MTKTNFQQLCTAALGACAIALALAACGDDGAGASDAGVNTNFSLEILSPPGDSIGLVFSGTSPLRVRYLDDQGLPLASQLVEFTLLDSGNESTGGASLSSADAITNAEGIAAIDLVAGAERVNYRVEASAAQAPSVIFYIQVSDQGFVNLEIRSAHEGPRDPESYQTVQLRIYTNGPPRCSEIDFDDLPQSFLQPHTQEAIGEVSEFVNLAADDAYTVIAWAEIAGGRPLAVACVNLPAARLRSGQTFAAVMNMADRSYQWDEPLEVEAVIDLRPMTSTLVGAHAWQRLGCPLGHAELLLDCLADAQTGDGLMDCDGVSTSPLSTGLATRRGVLGSDGCRLALDSEGGSSIDGLLQAALDAATGGWPSTEERAALAGGYASLTEEVRIFSLMEATSSESATHRLLRAQLGSAVSDLVASTRPVIESVGVPYLLDASPLLTLNSHAFTLRYGEVAAEHYDTLALAPANVSGLDASLGDEIMSGIAIASDTGCSALEDFVCNELELPAACANQCSGIASDLNTLLASWLPALQSTGVDYEFALAAALVDANNDLGIDSLSADNTVDAASVTATITTEMDTQSLPATVSATVAAAP